MYVNLYNFFCCRVFRVGVTTSLWLSSMPISSWWYCRWWGNNFFFSNL